MYHKPIEPKFPWDAVWSVAIWAVVGLVIWKVIGVGTTYQFLVNPEHFGIGAFLVFIVVAILAVD